MKIQPIINEDFYCLIAPDGVFQPSTLTADMPTCIAFIRLLHKTGMGESWHSLKMKGFKVEKVSVTIQPR